MAAKVHFPLGVRVKNRIKHSKKVFKQNTNEFLRNTTIHGLQYFNRKSFSITESNRIVKEEQTPQKRPYAFPTLYIKRRRDHGAYFFDGFAGLTIISAAKLSKFFFITSFVIVVLTCSYFLLDVITKWNTTPTIVSINPKATNIISEPFPAVTICNQNQADKRKVDNLSVFSRKFAMLQMMCKRTVNETIANNINDWSTLKDFIIDISQPCSRMLINCRYGGNIYNCSDLFHPVVTNEGLCCTFNMLDPKFMYASGKSNLDFNITRPKGYTAVNWNLEHGYITQPLPKYYTPRKTLGTGESLGLSLVLDVEAKNYYCSSGNSIGFKMAVHNANELPNMLETGMPIPPGVEMNIRMKAIKIEAEQRLRDMTKESRQCYFTDEMQLKVFHHYTQRNCEAECISDMLVENCGCITHYMPSVRSNVSICSIYDSTCVERVRLRAISDNEEINCNDVCSPSCYDNSYHINYYSLLLIHSGFEVTNPALRNYSSFYMENNIALINLYHKEHSYRSNVQTEFIDAVDVLSSCGGLISIFFGFSLISLTEFIFYAMIRPFRPLRGAQAKLAETRPFARSDVIVTTTKYQPLAQRAQNRLKNPFIYPTYSIYGQKRSVLYPAWPAKRPALYKPQLWHVLQEKQQQQQQQQLPQLHQRALEY